jgi:hypothetical protein
MVTFSRLILDANGKPGEIATREIKQSDMRKCPHFMLVAVHYRSDGTCRCDDLTHTEMAKWGYRWDSIRRQWRER